MMRITCITTVSRRCLQLIVNACDVLADALKYLVGRVEFHPTLHGHRPEKPRQLLL
ncbi:hypothetical protein Mal15_30140 [Stieleria maiorica]|uniref:Uncharacterized protein n=1 Tax=Stieleria maiorica TaxID=2795974 RepID=A0A5B9MFS2_9BACT|nr:hypothetical protein Mal15_30140 [Stieleria maiorica]